MTTRVPQWKTFNLLNGSALRQVRQVTQQTKNSLNRINKILDKAEDVLSSAQTFINVLKRLESIVDRGLFSFLDQAISVLQSDVDSIKSTGVYALDLFSYHFQKPPSIYEQNKDLAGEEWWKGTSNFVDVLGSSVTENSNLNNNILKELKELSSFLSKLGVKDVESDKKNLDDIISVLEKKKTQSQFTNNTFNFAILEKKIKTLKDLSDAQKKTQTSILEKLLSITYKQETYHEWIDVICDAFTDRNDRVSFSIFKSLSEEYKKEGDKIVVVEKMEAIPVLNKAVLRTSQIFKSGRPLFNDGDYVKVILVGYCSPSMEQIKDAINAITKCVDIITEDVGDKFKAFRGILETPNNSIKRWQRLGSEISEHLSQLTIQEQMTIGTEPNFFGVTLNTFFKDIFNYIDNLLGAFKNLNIPMKSSIFDSVDNIILSFKSLVSLIKYILAIIQELSNFIEALATLSQGFMLVVETNEGIPGVIKALKKTKPFTSVHLSVNQIMKSFGLFGDPDALMVITSGASTKQQMIENVTKYRNQVVKENAQNQIDYKEKSDTYTNLETNSTMLQTLFNQCVIFETALSASSYQSMVDAMNVQLAIYDGQITAKNVLIDAENAKTNSRSWLNTQITTITAELASTSSFNIANATIQANIQAQIDALDAQYNDPNAPLLPNYTTDRANLVNQKNVLIQQKSDHDDLYEDKLTRYSAVKVLVDAFCGSHIISSTADLVAYQNQIDTLEIDIATLKTNRTNTYNDYIDDRNANLLSQSTKQGQIVSKQSSIASKQGDISAYTAEKVYWEAVDPTGHASRISELAGLIATRNSEISILNGEISTLQGEITTLQAGIISLDAGQVTYDSQAVKDQEDKYLYREALAHWVVAETYRLEKVVIQSTRSSYYSSESTTINVLLNGLIEANIPVLVDSAYAEIITSLVNNEGFSVSFPESSKVQNAYSKMTMSGGVLYKADLETKISESKLNYTNSILSNLSEDFIRETTQELLKKNEEQFNPNEKMFYGGFLLCFGFPTTSSFDGSVTDIIAAGKKEIEITNGSVKNVTDSLSTLRSKSQGIFSKFFK